MKQYSENFEQCTKCTVCTVYCPVAAVNPLYPGPKQAGPDGERLRMKGTPYYDPAVEMCLNCKRCEVACPSDVRIGDIIQLARIKHITKRPGLREFTLANTDLVGGIATKIAPVVNATLGLKPMRYIVEGVMNVDHRRIFPKYAFGTFENWLKKQRKEQAQYSKQVAFFHGCYVNYNNPDLGKALVKVLNALGYGVQLLDKEKCCGVALISNGFINKATKQAQSNLKSISKAVAKGLKVVATSSTCTFTLRDEYHHLLGLDNSTVRDNIDLATRLVYNILAEENVALKFKEELPEQRIVYHSACHIERLGWSRYSIELLKMIPNLELITAPSQCCGIAGTYGFKSENYQTSQDIGSPLFDYIETSECDFVSTDCETCKWQIEMSTTKKVMHPIEILAAAIA